MSPVTKAREERHAYAMRSAIDLMLQAHRIDYAASLMPEGLIEQKVILTGDAINRRDKARQLCIAHSLDWVRVQQLTGRMCRCG